MCVRILVGSHCSRLLIGSQTNFLKHMLKKLKATNFFCPSNHNKRLLIHRHYNYRFSHYCDKNVFLQKGLLLKNLLYTYIINNVVPNYKAEKNADFSTIGIMLLGNFAGCVIYPIAEFSIAKMRKFIFKRVHLCIQGIYRMNENSFGNHWLNGRTPILLSVMC